MMVGVKLMAHRGVNRKAGGQGKWPRGHNTRPGFLGSTMTKAKPKISGFIASMVTAGRIIGDLIG
jgi:hypothetical protein